MSTILINQFGECQQCGECCKTPCDIIPTDLPPLLDKFKMELPNFFKKFLIALIIASPKYSDEVLMMVPVRVDRHGVRNPKYLADNEYLNLQGSCIFLSSDNKCSINEIKPFGGRFLKCPKMTGSVFMQLPKSQYFAFWVNNQHLFEMIFPGFNSILKELKGIYEKKNELYKTVGNNKEYNELHQLQINIISTKLFPLLNNGPAVQGYRVLV